MLRPLPYLQVRIHTIRYSRLITPELGPDAAPLRLSEDIASVSDGDTRHGS